MSFLKANLLHVIRREPFDHIPYEGEGSYIPVDFPGRKPPRAGLDEWGVRWEPLPESYQVGEGEPAESFPAAAVTERVDDLLALSFPSPPSAAEIQTMLRALAEHDALLIGQHPLGLLGRFMALLGTNGAFEALLYKEDLCVAVVDRIAAYHVGVARAYLAAGAGAGWFADDYAGSQGPLISPALWRRVILPGLVKVFAVYREADAPVFFHTCGRAEPFIADLLIAGADVFNLEGAACNLPTLKQAYGGRLALIGGVRPAVMLHAAPEQVRAAVQQVVQELGSEGRLILAPEQPLAYPAANVAAFRAAAQMFGRIR
jgi:uroporphyrinogen-III decarboxylase